MAAQRRLVAHEASLAHAKSRAILPKASLAECDQSVPEPMVELPVDRQLPHAGLSAESERVEWSNGVSMNSRMPMLDAGAAGCAKATVRRLQRKLELR